MRRINIIIYYTFSNFIFYFCINVDICYYLVVQKLFLIKHSDNGKSQGEKCILKEKKGIIQQ